MKLARYSTGVFLKGAEKQREVMQAILEEAFRVYTDLLYVPVPSPRNGSSVDDENLDLPIEDYDRLSTTDITGRLEDLSADEVEELKTYETSNKNRGVLVERFDRSLV